jgi:hypothetical protein
MKDYSVFYRKYKGNKSQNKKKQKESEKMKDLKRSVNQLYKSLNGGNESAAE